MNAQSKQEQEQILQTLNSTGLATIKFAEWMKTEFAEEANSLIIMPYCTIFSDVGRYGIVSYVADYDKSDGVSRIITCAYTPINEDKWKRLQEPYQVGDYYRLVLAPLREGKLPWPGATLLVSGGVSASGVQLPAHHLAKVRARIRDLQEEPVEQTVINILAFQSSIPPSEITPDMSLEKDLYTDTWDCGDALSDVFEITILSEDMEACETVQDYVDLVVRNIVIHTIALSDDYAGEEDADLIEPDMSLDEALFGADQSILFERLMKRFRINIDANDREQMLTVRDVIDLVRSKIGN